MSGDQQPAIVVVGDPTEFSADRRIWGTGGWVPPDQRVALDWLTLCRFLGWETEAVAASHFETLAPEAPRHAVILAHDASELSAAAVAKLQAWLENEPLLLIMQGARMGSPLAEWLGCYVSTSESAAGTLRWMGTGPHRNWLCQTIGLTCLQQRGGYRTWASLGGRPAVVAKQVGRGLLITLAFHPSGARDAAPAVTALLKNLLVWGPPRPTAWLDFSGTLVLRMDDPGGAQNVHSGNWSYPKLNKENWDAIASDLQRRRARLSIGYVAGWVDDGDARRGDLKVYDRSVPRSNGQIFPSPAVKYRDCHGFNPGTIHDYVSEYEGIQRLRASGLGDVELHGYTHMHPDHEAWSCANDRYEATKWFRELGEQADAEIVRRTLHGCRLKLGMREFERYFEVHPTTLIPPGDEWTDAVLETALNLDIQLVSSYYLAIRHAKRFCWTTHVCAPYLDEPDAKWFLSELPVVGYFHDRELALEGINWMVSSLNRWQACGASRMIDFRELASTLGHAVAFETNAGIPRLRIANHAGTPLVRSLRVYMRSTDHILPNQIAVEHDGITEQLEVQTIDRVLGYVVLEPRGRNSTTARTEMRT